MPAVNTWMHDYLRSARAGIIGGVAITAVYCFIAVLSTPRPSNGDLAAFAAVVVGIAAGCALLAAAAVLWARAGMRLLAALLAGLLGGPAVAFLAQLVLDGVPQGEGDTDRLMVASIASGLLGALVGAMCWVGARR